MKKKWIILGLNLAMVFAGTGQAAKKPKLVLGIMVDQFRYDYLTRFRKDFTGGLDYLLSKGAVFTNASYEHFPTVTAIGHSTFTSGATPAMSGIVGNDWYDRETGRNVTSVSDPSVKVLGGDGEGVSPHRLLVSTLGDEMRIANPSSKVIGLSFKERSAILPAGRMATAAYWFDDKAGAFISSTFYFGDLPGWVKDFNASRPADQYQGAQWLGRKLPDSGPSLYSALRSSPYGNELIERFTERTIEAEELGLRDATDLLVVSFSPNDYIGHELGPDAPEVRDISLLTDRVLDKLFRFIAGRIGMQNVLVVMTADHGVSPMPEVSASRRMPGGRMPSSLISETVEKRLAEKYGEGKWVASGHEGTLYLNQELILKKNLDEAEVERVAGRAALTLPHVFRVYTREQLMQGNVLGDQVGRRVMNGFHMGRGGDIYVLLDPYWMFASHGTSHGTTFSYDSHVPIIFMGPGIRPGRFYSAAAPNDIAPTLSTMLDVEVPSGSAGRVLAEIISPD